VSVTVTHPEYEARQDEWHRISAVLDGRDAVIAAGEDFVPMLGGQTPGQYQSYLLRGLWYGGTQRTRKGIVGLVFSQDPQVEVPSNIEPYMDDITQNDVEFNEFAKQVFNEAVAYNWGGILVDVPSPDEIVLPTDARPYLSFYHATNVRWWKQERIAGKMQTTVVILHETVEELIPGQEYGSECVEQYRVLKLEKETDVNGRSFYVYRQEEWRNLEDPNEPLKQEKKWRIVRTITPTRKDQPLNFIPFTFITTDGTEPHIAKSDLLDLVDVNLDHWRLSVDLRHGLHFTALPTPCASGIPDGLDLKIGSETAWTSTDPNFKSWYLEFGGSGIAAIDTAIDRDEHLMALLGSRLLETQKRASETAEAMIIRQASEDSVVMSAAESVSKGLEKALWNMSWWAGDEDPKVSVSLTSALQDLQLSTADMVVILKSYQAGLISQQAFLESFIRKNYIRGVDWETEAKRERIENPTPVGNDGTSSGTGNSLPTMDRGTVNLPAA
jgi:hypothetical protein